MKTEQGILSVDAATYHSDSLTDKPSLSASIAKLLINQSPAHAFAQHPRLNPHYVRVEDDKFSVGTVAHSVLLEGIDKVEVIEADSWRTNAAKEQREYARTQGKIPLLGKDYFDVLAMVDAAKKQLAEHQAFPPLFTDGKPEQTITWVEDGVQCKARLDWLHDDMSVIDDLKTSARSARPEDFARSLYGVGNDIQAAFYLRGLRKVRSLMEPGSAVPGRPPSRSAPGSMSDPIFRWCVIETAPPFALSVVTPGPDVLALADDKVSYALRLWKRCLESGEWPGFDRRVATAELPPFEEVKWMERSLAA